MLRPSKPNPVNFNSMNMKKKLTLLIAALTIFHLVEAQSNPALVTNFKIDGNSRSGYKVSWNVANNEVVNKFEVQRSINGRDYTTITVISTSKKTGPETYTCSEHDPQGTKLMYRLKMISTGQDVYYSNIVFLTIKRVGDEKITVLGNPVKDKLIFRFNEYDNPVDIKIYDVAGRVICTHQVGKVERNEIVSIPLNRSMSPGMYVADINNATEKLTVRFVKQ